MLDVPQPLQEVGPSRHHHAMRVSIITAVYNHERFLDEAIQSVVNQTYDEWELILWDDGSSDASYACCQRWARRFPDRIRAFQHAGGRNLGQERTRNAALKQTRGELLALLDSDDLYTRDKLRQLTAALADPKVGLAYGQTGILHQSTGYAEPPPSFHSPSGCVLRDLLRGNFISACSVVLRRSALPGREPFDSVYRVCGDYALWIRIARNWEFVHVPATVAWWRDHGRNTSTRLTLQAKEERLQILLKLRKDRAYQDYRSTIERSLAHTRYDLGSAHYDHGDLSRARAQLTRVLMNSSASWAVRVKASVLLGTSVLGRNLGSHLVRMRKTLRNLDLYGSRGPASGSE